MFKIDVPYINQSDKYPTGCESVTTVMLLHYLGYDISVDDFIVNNLSMREFEVRDGVLYGPNPWEYFAGSPYHPDAMGCYAPVICKALAAIVGEDENAYIFNDPYENRGVISCPKDIIVNRYYVYHSQAVALKPVPCAKG